jgi:hypothetical protein
MNPRAVANPPLRRPIATPAGLLLSPAVIDDCEALVRLFFAARLGEPPPVQAVALLIESARALRGLAAGLWCVRGAHEALLGCALVRPAEDGSLRHVAVALADRLHEQRHGLDILRGLARELDAHLCDGFCAHAEPATLVLARSTLDELSLLVRQQPHCGYHGYRGVLREVRLRAREQSAGVVWSAPERRRGDR